MKNIEINTFLDYKFLSNLDFNPEGTIFAFTLAEADLEKNNYRHSIWTYNLKTKKFRKITHTNKEKNSIWLNNDIILFSSDRNENLQTKIKSGETWTSFFAIDIANGGEAYEYMKIPVQVSAIKKIDENNFILTASFDNNSLNINNLKGEEREKAIKTFEENKDYEIIDEIPFWFNGQGFINKKRNRLYHFNSLNNELTAITDELTNVDLFNLKDKKIIFIAERYKDKLQSTNYVASYNLESKEFKYIFEDGRYNFSYANFIEDKIILALSDMKKFGINENHQLYIFNEGNLELLHANDTWLANTVGSDCRLGGGKNFKIVKDKLYFISTLNDSSYLNSLSLQGMHKILTEDEGSIDCFDVVDDKVVYIGMHNYRLQEIYELKDKKSEKLSTFNDKILENFKISLPEKFIFETNGDKTEGFVIKPVNFEVGKNYPAILDIHGGPKTVYGYVFYHEMQVWANMGYFVFFTNPHGSDGKGNVFADIRGKYGTIDYEDLMNFTDLVLEKYPVDKNRIGVTGGSYGGFMTNWIIGHTDRFSCAASQRSISNWISKFGTTDIGYYFNADQNQSTPWINHDKLWWHSPLKYADKAKTPTLFIHSEEDYRCWLPEGLQMFTALKYHGIDARLCMFKGENHELSRSGKPKHRIKRLQEITNWFEKYLK
ncbi:MAG: S9 family peptidase [Fusobacterium sp.]|uniref:alpha/beta hydrolase family protein n=1 Tax=Fusobacterium sp. TaxID=68766 RepID=UPI0026DC725E|nr:S9 family peptidase [Fusobacterium sp.]MDO4690534.1 S9 family peptidase [Fusobacterium sp.]